MREWILVLGLAACGGKTNDADGGATDDSGSMPVFTKCTVDTDCIIVPKSCCGSCGAATKTDEIAVAKSDIGNYRMSVCKNTACPACAMMQDPNLKARCTGGACEIAP